MSTLTAAPLVLARVVRVAVASVAVGLLAALGALNPQTAVSSQPAPELPAPSPAVASLLAQAIVHQESLGQTCQTDPELTDYVLFQFSGAEEIVVLTFNEALTQTALHAGWVRAYCA